MIAYIFPPEGSAGTFRPLRFVRCLPSMGWQPIVITLEAQSYQRYDPALLSQLPTNTKIIRVPNRDPWQRFQQWRQLRQEKKAVQQVSENTDRLRQTEQTSWRSFAGEIIRMVESCCYHPDPAMGWIRPAVKATTEICASKKPDILWATGGPWSSFFVAARASRITKVPYVLDFRDAWTLVREPFAVKRPDWAVRRDRRALYRLFKGAQAVVFRYQTEAECYWQAYPGALDAERIHIIPNGFDAAVNDNREIQGDKCQILYTGTLADYRTDTLLKALSHLKQTDSRVTERLRLVFIGECSERFLSQVEEHGVRDIITVLPPVPHAEIMKRQNEAHALLMLEREPTIKGYELLAGAKLFEYLRAGRPIVGVLPEGEAKKVLRGVGVTTIANSDVTDEIAHVIKQVLQAWTEGRLSQLAPDPLACAAFSAENQTAALVRALDRQPPIDQFTPGLLSIPPSLRDEIKAGAWMEGAGRLIPA